MEGENRLSYAIYISVYEQIIKPLEKIPAGIRILTNARLGKIKNIALTILPAVFEQNVEPACRHNGKSAAAEVIRS